MKDFEKQSNLTTLAKWWKNRQPGKYDNLRPATDTDIPALAHLYSVCFGDEDAEAKDFLRFFFLQPDFMMLLAVENETIISMLSLIPARLAINGRQFVHGFYLYGIGTLPEYRKKGFSNRLMTCAKEITADLGYDFLMLVPACSDLISFYEKQGFLTHFPKKEQTPSVPFEDCTEFTPISLKEYQNLRCNLEAATGIFSLSEPFGSYALEMIAENLRFYKKKKTGFCFYSSNSDDRKQTHSLHLLEQAAPFSNDRIFGGQVHQIYLLHPVSLPDFTYFQFPMDSLDFFK